MIATLARSISPKACAIVSADVPQGPGQFAPRPTRTLPRAGNCGVTLSYLCCPCSPLVSLLPEAALSQSRHIVVNGAQMNFYPTERIALFIDGANLYASAKSLAFDIDYKRLLPLFRSKGQRVRALYYTALAEEQEYSSIRPLIDWLDHKGYTMVTEPTKGVAGEGGGGEDK